VNLPLDSKTSESDEMTDLDRKYLQLVKQIDSNSDKEFFPEKL
jgi:hypothetical protein